MAFAFIDRTGKESGKETWGGIGKWPKQDSNLGPHGTVHSILFVDY